MMAHRFMHTAAIKTILKTNVGHFCSGVDKTKGYIK